jgi:recombination protein RecR
MHPFPGALGRLIDAFGRLPGVGPKTAQRLAYHVLRQDRGDVEQLSNALLAAKDQVRTCSVCFSYSEDEVCDICRDPRRNPTLLCVVEEPKDVWALERSREFSGRYHVLHGTLSPMDGVGPDQLKIQELLRRLEDHTVQEVILATNPDVEGEATAIYLHKLLKPLGVKVTRLASGLPAGGDLDYADDVTISRALGGRREL